MPRFPNQMLDDGRQVHFGQSLSELEARFGEKAFEHPLLKKHKVPGMDRKFLKAGLVTLEFDTGRLISVEFAEGYQFKHTPAPYVEAWKNFEDIGDQRIKAGMTEHEFVAYLVSWKTRAKNLGAASTEKYDVAENQYRLGLPDYEVPYMFSSIMGPSRRAGGRGIWADGWVAFFTKPAEIEPEPGFVRRLETLQAFCDEFNTVARKKS